MIHRLGIMAAGLALGFAAIIGLGSQSAFGITVINVTPSFSSLHVNNAITITGASVPPPVEQASSQELRYSFVVVSGPNTGASNVILPCNPIGCMGGSDGQVVKPVKWTYGSNQPGIDTVEVCALDIREQSRDCERVFVEWFRNVGAFPIGGVISDQAAENRARAAAAAAPPVVVPPSTGTGITISPPNTGDAGLARPTGSATTAYEAAAILAFGIAGLAALKFARR